MSTDLKTKALTHAEALESMRSPHLFVNKAAEFLRALAAAPAGGAEPVAWQYFNETTKHWGQCSKEAYEAGMKRGTTKLRVLYEGAGQAATTEGYRIVPEAMTDEMLHETWRGLVGACDHVTIREAYRRMLAAAPTAQPQPQPEPEAQADIDWHEAPLSCCPKCNSEDVHRRLWMRSDSSFMAQIVCRGCGLESEEDFECSMESIVTDWNDRPRNTTVLFDDRPQNQRIAEAEERMRNPAPLQWEDGDPKFQAMLRMDDDAQPERLPYCSAIDPTLLAIHARTVERAERLGLDDAQPEAPAEPSEPAPPNSLPDWAECSMRVANSNFIERRIAEGGYGPEHDTKLATQLHRFIHEYDDADPYRSAWFLHRLELLLNEVRTTSAPVAQQPAVLTDAARDVLAERARQIAVEGWSPAHDDATYRTEELAFAASCYATADEGDAPPAVWPFPWVWWKPKDRRRNLIKAGALILAEIERLDRAAIKAQGGSK